MRMSNVVEDSMLTQFYFEKAVSQAFDVTCWRDVNYLVDSWRQVVKITKCEVLSDILVF